MTALVVIGSLIAAILILGVGVLIGLVIGIVLCSRTTADEWAGLIENRRQLQIEWDALKDTERDNQRFWAARTAMRDEALRHRQPSPDISKLFDRPSR